VAVSFSAARETGSNAAFLTWLMCQKHRPNLLITCTTATIDDVRKRLVQCCVGPIHESHGPEEPQLPADKAGTLILTDVSALTPDQQSKLNDWISAGQGSLQIVSFVTMPLESLLDAGRFSAGLFYRLNTVRFEVQTTAGPGTVHADSPHRGEMASR
jgi:transcriptional regulator of acetoin/glycerol metabolism